MRATAVTGTTSPSAVFHTMRARTNCDERSVPSGFRTVPLTRIDCVASSTLGEMKLTVVVASVSRPSLLSTRSGSPIFRSPDALDRHRHVHLERVVLLDRRQQRLRRDLHADARRHVADDAGGRRGDRVVAQLHLLLLHLRLQRLRGCASAVRSAVCACSSSCLLMAPAANSSLARCCCCRAKATLASRAARSASWLDTAACWRCGSICISRRALADAIARLHEDLGDLPVDLRLDRRRPQRLERRDVLGRVFERGRPRVDELDRRRRKRLAGWPPGLPGRRRRRPRPMNARNAAAIAARYVCMRM